MKTEVKKHETCEMSESSFLSYNHIYVFPPILKLVIKEDKSGGKEAEN